MTVFLKKLTSPQVITGNPLRRRGIYPLAIKTAFLPIGIDL
jgi:hypothetical protein